MRPLVGRAVLVLSAAGYPLTEAVIRRFGRPGATVVAAICLGLLARDTVLIRPRHSARVAPCTGHSAVAGGGRGCRGGGINSATCR